MFAFVFEELESSIRSVSALASWTERTHDRTGFVVTAEPKCIYSADVEGNKDKILHIGDVITTLGGTEVTDERQRQTVVKREIPRHDLYTTPTPHFFGQQSARFVRKTAPCF